MDSLENYAILLKVIEKITSLSEISSLLDVDRNTALVRLYELKSLGWVDTEDIENWYVTDYGLQAKKLLFPTNIWKKPIIDSESSNIVITFPREYGILTKHFPTFVETTKIVKNELMSLEKGDEVLILSYSVDFKVLSQILEDPEIIPSGKEGEFLCKIQYFHGYNEAEIEKIQRSGFNVELNKLRMLGPGQPHAKVIIFKKSRNRSMIISSANLTDNVFSIRNLEVGIYVKDETLVNELESFYSWLWKRTSLD